MMFLCFNISYAGFMNGVEGLIKSTLSTKKKNKFPHIETVGTVSGGGSVSSVSFVDSVVTKVKKKVRKTLGAEEKSVLQKDSFFEDIIDKAKDTVGLGKKDASMFSTVLTTVGIAKKPKKEESMLESVFSTVKSTMGIEKEKKKSVDFSLTGMMSSVTDTMGITKKDTSILGELKSSGTGVFTGFKNSGKAAEFMSGATYKSTKLYNKMFNVFSDSPLNIFEDKKKKETSVFDVFDTGNKLLDLWD